MNNMFNLMKLNKMKRLIAILMLVLKGMTAVAQTSVWDGNRALWTHGEGTENNPYLIESAAHLAYLAYMVNKGFETYGLHFRLTTDIDLNGSEDQQWIPIGLGNRWFNEDGCDRGTQTGYGFFPNTSFRGHFDGGEHSVSNIYVDNESYYAGLFGSAVGIDSDHPAVIENLVLTKIGEKSFCRRGMLDGPRIVLSSAEVKAPRSVRYLFKRPWRGCVYNEANLPMGAFCISNLDFTGGKQ